MASIVDFFVGMTAAGGADFVDAAVVFAGEEAFNGPAGELLLFAAGDADFSVATDTLGSVAVDGDFSGAVASGVGADVAVSS
ncbi:MAG TPA: hypothetical protein VF345_04280 [Chthoniobacterales bacterium]